MHRFVMEVNGRRVEGDLQERMQARRTYDNAIAQGKRASIAEEERPGVFTIRVGNLMPGEQAAITVELSGALPVADGEVTYRFPLVVAPRFMPSAPCTWRLMVNRPLASGDWRSRARVMKMPPSW